MCKLVEICNSVLLLLGLTLFFYSLSSADTLAEKALRTKKETSKPAGFAVIEIFTSEASAKYEEADRLAGLIAERRSTRGEEIYLLVYHVDYANDVFWTDPYALRSATDRQLEFGSAFRLGQAKPGVVFINGRSMAAASSFAGVNAKIRRELDTPTPARLKVRSTYLKADSAIKLDFQVDGIKRIKQPFFYFRVATVDDAIARYITAGPNKGYSSSARGTVLSLESVRFKPSKRKGSLEITLPRRVEGGRGYLICFVEDPRNKRILAAAEVDLPKEALKPNEAR